ILGDAVDFAVMSLDIEPNRFGQLFAVSDTSKQFAIGNPKYVAGMNGCELSRKVLTETNATFTDTEDAMFLDKGPEYWAGWALAFYQWYSGYSFMDILQAVSIEKIIAMYPIYHEMDIMQFVDKINEEIKVAYPQTKLKILREASGLSQSELGIASGVPLRQIQLFEQRQRDINKTAAETLLKLSKTLCCKMEDLIEQQ
ncbi:MAG: helix-turn-helix transcriptional regulator, partial [Candidatus Riflebacteria bacterium]|nr:helix-turn-helix transcriptional regulator [Candidatus Riflebacteria bacterium]